MDHATLKERVLGLVPDAEFQENKQFLTLVVPAEKLRSFAQALKGEADLAFDYLFCLSAVDRPGHLEVVYHLESTAHRHMLVFKVRTADRENATVDTVSDIWRTAEFHEREAYDLLGIRFTGHPDLRRLFLDEDWKGHPLRKDYTDDVNIIEL